MEEYAVYQERAKMLERLGALYITYDPRLRVIVAKAMEAWDAFCALPDEKKVLFSYSPDTKVSGNGYELKREGLDQKEDCHLRVNARDELLFEAAKAHPEIGPAFVEAALAINSLLPDVVRDFARMVEREYGVEHFEEDVMAKQSQWLLRFLHYFGNRQPGEVFAAAHPDKGGFTLHLYESDGGVEYFDYATRTWRPLPLAHDQTVMFPGMGLQHRSRCRLRALTHRVMVEEGTALKGRTSAVCFLGFRNTRYYNKPQFGSTQGLVAEHGPDYLYDMSFENFDKFFRD